MPPLRTLLLPLLLLSQMPRSGLGQEKLPLVEVPAAGPVGPMFAFMISGDGNWTAATGDIAGTLAEHGIPVVGLKARDYLARKRTPDEVAGDVEGVLRSYLQRWGDCEIVLIGYSRGAVMMPFVANRLSPDLRDKIRMVALLGPTEYASFEFHMIDLVRDVRRTSDLPLLPEVERMVWTDVLCVYGDDEKDSLCESAPSGLMRVVRREGGHRIHDGASVGAIVLDALKLPTG